jgi:hypothetical protein
MPSLKSLPACLCVCVRGGGEMFVLDTQPGYYYHHDTKPGGTSVRSGVDYSLCDRVQLSIV